MEVGPLRSDDGKLGNGCGAHKKNPPGSRRAVHSLLGFQWNVAHRVSTGFGSGSQGLDLVFQGLDPWTVQRALDKGTFRVRIVLL